MLHLSIFARSPLATVSGLFHRARAHPWVAPTRDCGLEMVAAQLRLASRPTETARLLEHWAAECRLLQA